MAALARFPDVAQVAAATPADRDRVVDVIRITSLIGVVLGHTVMAISIIRDHVLIWDNLLTASVVFQAATWMLQIMPLFFFAGAAACLSSWSAGTNWGDWLMKRCTRLFRPVFYYLAFWAVALTVLYRVLRQHIYEPVAGVSTQLLWFLGAYVLVLAAMPVLYRITTAGRLAAGVAGVYGAIAAIDAIRLHWPAMMPLGYLNLVVWLIPAMFGIAYRRRLLTGRAALVIAAVGFAVDVALVHWGPYQISMVGTGDHHLSNTSPPSLLLAGHTIILSALAIAAAPVIARWAQRPRVWWWTAIGNSGAMTLYLWHMPVLLGVHLVFDCLGAPRYPGAPDFLVISLAQLIVVIGAVAVLFVALRPLENNPLSGWDGAPTVTGRGRGAAVGALLCVAGVAILAAIRWGLKDDGLVCMAVMVAALVGARVVAAPAQRLTAARS
ncbi:acyltransferase family protein [Mycobacterium paraseoulense]|uniref:Acyltransferase n=1 Tax=Mycobacterium paraseoulense TaxID=590652 RepID=A0A1X0I7R3_9MYCO|nr:acyltransferase [Mycobacterium paraseoulense]MCV7393226.1 acyltransferase [Mycobacterium paraseoulense]ORB38088.1 acyltransferase [Mycobacterium paraseoulense]BBZ68934.1 acyltransferase [Mycobacterium paraseoulense]